VEPQEVSFGCTLAG